MNVSLPAIKMLGDLLTEQEQRINELWQLYQFLMS